MYIKNSADTRTRLGYVRIFLSLCAAWTLAAPTLEARNILFIDLNNATAEIEAVRGALVPGRDQLFVVPSLNRLDAKRRQSILRISQQIKDTTAQSLDCAKHSRMHCESQWSKLRALDLEHNALTQHYAIKELSEDIAQVVPRGSSIDVLVISGHHSGSYFRGELATLEANDLLRFDVELAEQFGSTQSLLLLGCETGVPALMGDLFIKALPSVQLVVGAEDRAPTRNETRNLQFIRQLVRSESQLITSRDLAQVEKTYRSLLAASWPVSILWQRHYFFSRHWRGKIDEMPERVAATFAGSVAASNRFANADVNVDVRARVSPTPSPPLRVAGPTKTANVAKEPMLTPAEAANVLYGR